MLHIVYRSTIWGALGFLVATFLGWDAFGDWKWVLPAASAGLFSIGALLLITLKWRDNTDDRDSVVPAIRKGGRWIAIAGLVGTCVGGFMASGSETWLASAIVTGITSALSTIIMITAKTWYSLRVKQFSKECGPFWENKGCWLRRGLCNFTTIWWVLFIGLVFLGPAVANKG